MSKIDVHAHVVPPIYKAALENAGGDPSGWIIPSARSALPPGRVLNRVTDSEWTALAALDAQDTFGVKIGVLSVTSPGKFNVVPLAPRAMQCI